MSLDNHAAKMLTQRQHSTCAVTVHSDQVLGHRKQWNNVQSN